MALASMKTDDQKACCEVGSNPYGYGLTINLNDDQCEALGIKTPLAAGAVVSLQAVAMVQSVTQSVEDDGDDQGPDIRMTLQITDMELKGSGQPTAEESAILLYGPTKGV